MRSSRATGRGRLAMVGHAVTLMVLCGVAALAQSPSRDAHPRVAVVLSGGSAKGFSQIGALQVIEEAGVPVDLVTGTSMGAIIGGLYAAGYTPAELERLATSEDWTGFFRRPIDRRGRSFAEKDDDQRYALTVPLNRARPGLPTSVVSRQGVAVHIERFTWPVSDDTDFAALPTQFAALTTDLATGKAVLLRSGSLAQAMEASAAVPGAFPPVRLANGRLAVDGAVVRNIPASDARSLGADFLICVDVSERIAPVDSLRSLIDIVDQTVAFRVQWSNEAELPLCNVVIDPEVGGIPSVAFGLASEWIARGRTAARAHLRELAAIADSVRRVRGPVPPRRGVPRLDSILVRAIHWTPVSPGADGIVRGTLGLQEATWLTLPQIEDAVTRLYSTGRFDQVSFRVVPERGAHDLWLDLTESDRDVLGVGVRYDTPRGVAVLADVDVVDWLSAGSDATLGARLGGEQRFDARDVLGAGPSARFTQTYRLTARRTTLPERRTLAETAEPRLDVREAAAAIEGRLGTTGSIGMELGHEWNHDGAVGGTLREAMRRQSFTTLAATVRVDTYDRSVLPTAGYAVLWRSELASHDGAGATFTRHILVAQGTRALGDDLALLGRVDIGRADGAALPLDRGFFLGGSIASAVFPTEFIPFLGLAPQSRLGTAEQVLHLGVRARVRSSLVVTALGDAGNVFDTWPARPRWSDYLFGGGVSVTTLVPIGPISLTLGSRGRHTRPIVELSAGSFF